MQTECPCDFGFANTAAGERNAGSALGERDCTKGSGLARQTRRTQVQKATASVNRKKNAQELSESGDMLIFLAKERRCAPVNGVVLLCKT
jgi:hypothetical protein